MEIKDDVEELMKKDMGKALKDYIVPKLQKCFLKYLRKLDKIFKKKYGRGIGKYTVVISFSSEEINPEIKQEIGYFI